VNFKQAVTLTVSAINSAVNLPPPQPFYGPFSGTTQVSQCQKKASSGLFGAREHNKRQTHRQSSWAPLHPDQSAVHFLHELILHMLVTLTFSVDFELYSHLKSTDFESDCCPDWVVSSAS